MTDGVKVLMPTDTQARPLEVEKDLEPVIEFMRSKGVQVGDVYKIIVGHPPVLSYAPEHLNKFWVREAF